MKNLNYCAVVVIISSLFLINSSFALTINYNKQSVSPVCSGDTLIFTVLNTANKTNYNWTCSNIFTSATIASLSGNSASVFRIVSGLDASDDGLIQIDLSVDSTDGSTLTYTTGFLNTRPTPKINIISSQTKICPGKTLSLTASVVGITGAMTYSYRWTVGNTTISSAFNASATASGTYNALAIDQTISYCIGRKSITLDQVLQPKVKAVSVSGKPVKCFGTPLELNGEVTTNSTGEGTYSFNWKPAAGIAFGELSKRRPSVNPTLFTTYEIVLSDANGCKDSSTISISINSAQNIINSISDVTLCKFETRKISATASGGTTTGANPYRYVWNPSAGVSNPSVADPNFTALLPDNGTIYTVTGIDAGNCSVTSTVTVRKAKLEMNFRNTSDSLQVCSGTTLGLNVNRKFGNPAFRYVWSSVGANIKAITDTTYTTDPILSDSKFYVTVRDSDNCSDKDSLIVSIIPSPKPSLVNKNIIACLGTNVSVNIQPTISGVYTYTWLPNTEITNSAIPNPSFAASKNVSSRTYQFTIFDANTNCSSTDSIKILSTALPDFKINEPSETVYIGTSTGFSTNAANGISLVWSVSGFATQANQNAIFTFDSVKIYRVYAIGTDANGCINTDTLELKVRKFSNQTFYIPNVFSPNSTDARNSSFKIFDGNFEISDSAPFNLKIFNLFGAMVFNSDSYQEMTTTGWSGEGYTSGSYTYFIKGSFVDETTFSKTGGVTMFK